MVLTSESLTGDTLTLICVVSKAAGNMKLPQSKGPFGFKSDTLNICICAFKSLTQYSQIIEGIHDL